MSCGLARNCLDLTDVLGTWHVLAAVSCLVPKCFIFVVVSCQVWHVLVALICFRLIERNLFWLLRCFWRFFRSLNLTYWALLWARIRVHTLWSLESHNGGILTTRSGEWAYDSFWRDLCRNILSDRHWHVWITVFLAFWQESSFATSRKKALYSFWSAAGTISLSLTCLTCFGCWVTRFAMFWCRLTWFCFRELNWVSLTWFFYFHEFSQADLPVLRTVCLILLCASAVI